jgi:hypothetical protein
MTKIFSTLLMLCVIFLVSCDQESTDDGEKSGSYAAIVVINGKEYNGINTKSDKDKDKEQGEKIGTITNKTKADVMPKESESNYYEVGSEIYAVKGTDKYIIVKTKDNKEMLLESAPN